MKHKTVTLVLAGIMCFSLAVCSQTYIKDNRLFQSEQAARVAAESEKSTELRTITDLGGNKVNIPAVSEIKRIVILSPPVMSFVVNVIPDTNMIVGINSRAFTGANADIVNKVFPNWKSVNTSFVDAGFAINKESLLALKPDIIFYYGNVQKKGLQNIDIPCVDFFSKQLNDPEAVSIAWDKQLREILGLDSTGSLQEEWAMTNKELARLLKDKSNTKSALCIFSNTAGKIVISGTDSFDAYTQSFFYKAGIRNVAAGVQGTSEVGMEQIYKWNPDMIIVFHDAPAQSILDNSIKGQDWSLLDAWKNKAVYDVPRTTYSWITPCADSPLMPLWLVSKAYPDLLDANSMKSKVLDYYQRNYRISLSDDDISSIWDRGK